MFVCARRPFEHTAATQAPSPKKEAANHMAANSKLRSHTSGLPVQIGKDLALRGPRGPGEAGWNASAVRVVGRYGQCEPPIKYIKTPIAGRKVFSSWWQMVKKTVDPIRCPVKNGGSNWIPFLFAVDPIFLQAGTTDPIFTRE